MPFFTTIEHFSILLITSQNFSPFFSTFDQLSTGCRQIYGVPADLPGAGRFTGCCRCPTQACSVSPLCLSLQNTESHTFHEAGAFSPSLFTNSALHFLLHLCYLTYCITRTLPTQNVSTSDAVQPPRFIDAAACQWLSLV